MEHHNHETFEITHEGNPFNEFLDALEYNQIQIDKRIQTLAEILLKLDFDTATKFALREILNQ